MLFALVICLGFLLCFVGIFIILLVPMESVFLKWILRTLLPHFLESISYSLIEFGLTKRTCYTDLWTNKEALMHRFSLNLIGGKQEDLVLVGPTRQIYEYGRSVFLADILNSISFTLIGIETTKYFVLAYYFSGENNQVLITIYIIFPWSSGRVTRYLLQHTSFSLDLVGE